MNGRATARRYTFQVLRALVLAAILAPGVARADRDLCAPGTPHHGAPIDLDVEGADVHDVMRLIANVAHVNVVVSDQVAGKLTLTLHRVPWDAAACAIAGVLHLRITIDGNVVLVRPAPPR